MNEQGHKNSPEDGEVQLLDYLIILAKHSRMIIFVSAAVTILTFVYLFCSPNIYKAMARIMLPQQNLTLSAQLLDSLGARVTPGGVGGAAPGGLAASLLGLKSSGDMYVAMMSSDTVYNRIIDRFHLMKLYKTRYLEDARKVLAKNTAIGAGRKDSIIFIEVKCTTPKLAAEMANAFIEELDRLLQDLALREATGRLAFLEPERLRASQNLSKAEESVRRFSEQNSVLQIDIQTRGAIEYIAQLRAEIDAKEVSIQVMRGQATQFNYDLVRLEMEVKGLKEKLRSAEAQRDNCFSDVCLPGNKAPTLALEYMRLLREAKFQESLYKLYTKLVEVARLDIARDVAVVQVLAPAIPPEKKINKRLFPSILAGMIGFLMMIFVAFGLEYVQNMNNREEDVKRLSVLKDYLRPWKDILTQMKKVLGFKKRS